MSDTDTTDPVRDALDRAEARDGAERMARNLLADGWPEAAAAVLLHRAPTPAGDLAEGWTVLDRDGAAWTVTRARILGGYADLALTSTVDARTRAAAWLPASPLAALPPTD